MLQVRCVGAEEAVAGEWSISEISVSCSALREEQQVESQAEGRKILDVDPGKKGLNRETEKQLFGVTRGALQLSLSRRQLSEHEFVGCLECRWLQGPVILLLVGDQGVGQKLLLIAGERGAKRGNFVKNVVLH